MTSIKCRYTIPYCTCYGFGNHTRVYHDEFWGCDTDLYCPKNSYRPPKDTKVLNPQCVYCKYQSGEFEKTVKRYKYEDGILTVARNTYLEHEIDYLEIDGRTLVKSKESD